MKLFLLSLVASIIAGKARSQTRQSPASAQASKLNLTTIAAADGKTALQCWQIEDTSELAFKEIRGYRFPGFTNTTLWSLWEQQTLAGHLPATYSVMTMIEGSLRLKPVDYTVRPGHNRNVLFAITASDAPSDYHSTIQAPLYLVQQYSDSIPVHHNIST